MQGIPEVVHAPTPHIILILLSDRHISHSGYSGGESAWLNVSQHRATTLDKARSHGRSQAIGACTRAALRRLSVPARLLLLLCIARRLRLSFLLAPCL